MPTADKRRDFTTDRYSDSKVDASHDEKRRQRRHKRKSKRKQEKVAAPPPLRPRSRPVSQQSGARSEGTSSGGGVAELGEGSNAAKLNEKQDAQMVTVSTGSKEDMKVSDSIITQHDNEQVTTMEETPAPMSDDETQIPNEGNNINNNVTDPEAIAE